MRETLTAYAPGWSPPTRYRPSSPLLPVPAMARDPRFRTRTLAPETGVLPPDSVTRPARVPAPPCARPVAGASASVTTPPARESRAVAPRRHRLPRRTTISTPPTGDEAAGSPIIV